MFNMAPSLWASHKRSDTEMNHSGFNFSNCMRNRALAQRGLVAPKPFTSGTTVAGIMFTNGVVLGSDSLAKGEVLINSQNAEKIFRLHKFIFAAGAGGANDLRHMANFIESEMDLVSMNTCRRHPPVCAANKLLKRYLYRFKGLLRVSFIVAGVGLDGCKLFSTHFDGSSDRVPYTALGSGTMAAMGVLESRWNGTLDERAARDLVCDAVGAGIENDLFSGASVNLCIIRNDFTIQMSKQPVYVSHRNIPRPLGVQPVVIELGHMARPNVEVVGSNVYSVTSPPPNELQPWLMSKVQWLTPDNDIQQEESSDDETYREYLLDDDYYQQPASTCDLQQQATLSPRRKYNPGEPPHKKHRH